MGDVTCPGRPEPAGHSEWYCLGANRSALVLQGTQAPKPGSRGSNRDTIILEVVYSVSLAAPSGRGSPPEVADGTLQWKGAISPRSLSPWDADD